MAQEKKFEGGRKASGVVIPPEGGWGWMIVASCFLATICGRAVTRCVSVFFVEFQLHFEKDYSSIAWIHSLIDSTTMLCAPLGGFLANRISSRATMILGGLLSSAGLVLGSFASSLEHLYICVGILTGLGFAFSYTPALAMVGKYFVERKALAYGIALSGNGIGQFILAPVVQMLIEHYSWRGALLIMGGFVSNLCVCGALMRPLKPRGTKRLWENSVAHLERDCMTSMLDLKDGENVAADCRQEEPQEWKSNLIKGHGLLIPCRGSRIFALDDNKQVQGRMGFLSSLRGPSLTAQKVAEGILLSNKLTETMQGGIKHPDCNLPNGGTTEELELTESMNPNNKAADMDEKIESLTLGEVKSNGVYHVDERVSAPPECMVATRTASRILFCLKSREEFGSLLSSEFLTLTLSVVFLAYACTTPVIYLIPYALSVGIGHKQAALLMSTLGISSIVGNITFGWIADRKCVRRYRVLSFMAALGMDGLCCVFVPLLQSFPLLVPLSVLFGYFEGAYVALIPVVTSDVAGPTYLTSALGVIYCLHAIPYLISPPIGGWLVDKTGSYAATFFISAASFMSCSAVLGAAMLVRRCRRSRTSSGVRLSRSHVDAAAAQQGSV